MKKSRIQLFISAMLASIFCSSSYASFTATFHRVGEGNCTTIAIPANSDSKSAKRYMIVDCGSNEIGSSNILPAQQIPAQPRTPEIERREIAIPPSTQKPPRVKTNTESTSINIESIGRSEKSPVELKQEAIIGIRQSLGQKQKEKISVQTVVVSHPDIDHFNLIPNILKPGTKDTLENIVLGGNPEKYLKNVKFRKWLLDWQKMSGTKVFFLALLDPQVPVKDLIKNINEGIYNPIAPSYLSDLNIPTFTLIPENFNKQPYNVNHDLVKAFDFGGEAVFQILTANPLHVPQQAERKGYMRLFYLPDEIRRDDNVDSIILRIVNKGKEKKGSMVLMGDATGLTMRKVISNYDIESLKSNILLSSHHGASSGGSNNEELFNYFQPDCVIFSNGQHDGNHHPKEEAYDNAKAFGDIKPTAPHEITRYFKKDEKYRTFETHRAIFSTFDNGNIEINFKNEGNIQDIIDITANKQEYKLIMSEEQEEEIDIYEREEGDKSNKLSSEESSDTLSSDEELESESEEESKPKKAIEVEYTREALHKFLNYLYKEILKTAENKTKTYEAITRGVRKDKKIPTNELPSLSTIRRLTTAPNHAPNKNYEILWQALKINFAKIFEEWAKEEATHQ